MAKELWNDLMYNEVLQSDGFVVDFAICTTYSLDMPTLLSVPFILGAMGELTDRAMHAPHILLEAINKASGRFAVFCNAGCIAVPRTASKVYSLLEKSVVQIALSAQGRGFVNFHPKVWIVKETNPDTGEVRIKLVVLSRNLTMSSDLDVVCELSGTVATHSATRKSKKKHSPLIDFLSWLREQAHEKRITRNIDDISECIDRIEEFDLSDSSFDDYDFFPMGIDGYNGFEQWKNDESLRSFGNILVISPFVDVETLKEIARPELASSKTLITRYDSITNEMLPLFKDGVYAVKDILTDANEKETVVDIHEKVYFVNAVGYNYLYLGSTNATKNGFGRNVEFLLRLRFAMNKTSYNSFRSELINDSRDCMFEQVTAVADEPKKSENATDELLLRQAISAIYKARVEECGKKYDITLQCKKHIADSAVFIAPLGCEGLEVKLEDGVCFKNLDLLSLTELYVIRANGLSRVIKIDTIDLPEADRDQAIFRSIINTKSKFINYLAFMLAESPEEYLLESAELEKKLASGGNVQQEQILSVSLYEDMVRATYRTPELIADFRRIIDTADKEVIPDNLDAMYRQFEIALKRIKRL